MPRVVLVDDDESVRITLRRQLKERDIQVVGEASDGFEATREIKKSLPHVQVVFVTVYDEPHPTRAADEVGAYAYLLKDSSPELMREVILRAAQAKIEREARDRREA